MAESRDDDWSVVVVSSTRSTAWSPAIGTPWSSRHSHAAVSCQKKLLVMGGFDAQLGSLNDVWSSPDGREWEQLPAAAWSARDGHRAVVKDGAVYVLGGADKYQDPMECLNDVWKSEDAGETWALLSATGHKPNHWIGRWQHGGRPRRRGDRRRCRKLSSYRRCASRGPRRGSEGHHVARVRARRPP